MEKLLKNPWILALSMVLAHFIFGFILIGIYSLINIEFESGNFGILAAIFLGWFYSKKFNEEMPKKLRLKASLIFSLAMLAFNFIAAVVLVMVASEQIPFLIIASIFAFILTFFKILIEGLIIYWILGFMGRINKNKAEKIKME